MITLSFSLLCFFQFSSFSFPLFQFMFVFLRIFVNNHPPMICPPSADRFDRAIMTTGPQYISWALGPINDDGLATYHNTDRTPGMKAIFLHNSHEIMIQLNSNSYLFHFQQKDKQRYYIFFIHNSFSLIPIKIHFEHNKNQEMLNF